jgi:hypothetical protein
VTTATEDGVATPTTFAGGGVLAAAELPPPQALNSTAVMAIKEAIMVFTTDVLLKFDTCAAHIWQAAGWRSVGALAHPSHRPILTYGGHLPFLMQFSWSACHNPGKPAAAESGHPARNALGVFLPPSACQRSSAPPQLWNDADRPYA